MKNGRTGSGRWGALLAGLALVGASGCASAYMEHRRDDALEMLDFGVTVTKTAQLAVYKACTPLFTIGYADVEGRFFGLGGGRFGSMPFFVQGVGLALWGWQKIGWDEFDIEKPETYNYDGAGPFGAFDSGPFPGPDYMMCCVQYLHLGYVGVVLNARWMQMADFLLGWAGLDICGDDGRRFGTWGEPVEVPAAAQPAAAPAETK